MSCLIKPREVQRPVIRVSGIRVSSIRVSDIRVGGIRVSGIRVSRHRSESVAGDPIKSPKIRVSRWRSESVAGPPGGYESVAGVKGFSVLRDSDSWGFQARGEALRRGPGQIRVSYRGSESLRRAAKRACFTASQPAARGRLPRTGRPAYPFGSTSVCRRL